RERYPSLNCTLVTVISSTLLAPTAVDERGETSGLLYSVDAAATAVSTNMPAMNTMRCPRRTRGVRVSGGCGACMAFPTLMGSYVLRIFRVEYTQRLER